LRELHCIAEMMADAMTQDMASLPATVSMRLSQFQSAKVVVWGTISISQKASIE
jgi:hypothetical protein